MYPPWMWGGWGMPPGMGMPMGVYSQMGVMQSPPPAGTKNQGKAMGSGGMGAGKTRERRARRGKAKTASREMAAAPTGASDDDNAVRSERLQEVRKSGAKCK